jgi:sugar phosphate isomerase/epimerase
MKVVLSTHIFALRELNGKLLNDIAVAGFRAVELWCSRQHLGYHRPERIKEVLRGLRDNGLEIASLHAPFYRSVEEARAGRFITLSSPELRVREAARAEIEMLLENLPVDGFIPLVLHTGLTASGEDPRLEEYFLTGLEELLPSFSRAGLRVALENGPGRSSGCAKILDLVKRCSNKEVGICLDTGHSNITGSLLEDLALCGDRLLSLHVHDNDGTGDQHSTPYRGNIPWDQFMAALRGMGYGGPFTMETAGDLQPHRFLVETARSMEKLGFPWPEAPDELTDGGGR